MDGRYSCGNHDTNSYRYCHDYGIKGGRNTVLFNLLTHMIEMEFVQ